MSPEDNWLCGDPVRSMCPRHAVPRTPWPPRPAGEYVVAFAVAAMIGAWLAGVVIFIVAATAAKAQEFGDYGAGHAEFHHWYQTGEPDAHGKPGPVMRPHQPNVACCNGDCRPTRVRIRAGGLEVWIDRKWRRVPAARIKDIPTPNGTTHACATRPDAEGAVEIFCVMPGRPVI